MFPNRRERDSQEKQPEGDPNWPNPGAWTEMEDVKDDVGCRIMQGLAEMAQGTWQ